MATLEDLVQQWRDALESWAIPQAILDQAPATPWIHPPKMFKADDDPAARRRPDTPSFAAAVDALSNGGSVLDVGCGGGRSSLTLCPPATSLVGVDEQTEMLRMYREAADAQGTPVNTFEGRWQEIATIVPTADVVVCHHVAYNVADIAPFLRALSDHAHRRVVVELPAHHPLSPLNALWTRFWGIERPTQPSAELFVAIVQALGWDPSSTAFERPESRAAISREELVAFTRQRLCLGPERDPEIDTALGSEPRLTEPFVWSVHWDL